MSAPRLFVPSPSREGHRIALPAAEAHHATRVLRLRDGDRVHVFDGAGREWAGTLVSSPTPAVAGIEDVVPVPEPPVRVTLALALLRGDQMDHAVRDATMLGVAALQPMVTEHVTVPSRAWASGTAVDRWQRVAVASAKQCGRAIVPDIAPVRPFTEIVSVRVEDDARLLCAEPATGAVTVSVSQGTGPRPMAATVFVGPEGGWSPAEVEQAVAAGIRVMGLGPRTLRAEAVPAIALAALWTVWGFD